MILDIIFIGCITVGYFTFAVTIIAVILFVFNKLFEVAINGHKAPLRKIQINDQAFIYYMKERNKYILREGK